jgi:quinol-cytochrome oxidoreductase complex cytochrome b subunit
VLLSRIRGLALPAGVTERDVRDRRPFFSEFLLLDASLWLVLFGALVSVSTFWPASVGVQADLLKPAPEGIKPEWYFLFLFQTLKVLPEALAFVLWAIAAALFVGLPFIDRPAARTHTGRGIVAAVVLLLVYAVVFEVSGIVTPGVVQPPESLTADTFRPAANLVSLGLLWLVIGFLVFYLWRLADENGRIRRLYRNC